MQEVANKNSNINMMIPITYAVAIAFVFFKQGVASAEPDATYLRAKSVVADTTAEVYGAGADSKSDTTLIRSLGVIESGPIIYGGTLATSGEFPSFAYLENVGCGGSLVWENVVLSAAHCPIYGRVRVGSIYKDKLGLARQTVDGSNITSPDGSDLVLFKITKATTVLAPLNRDNTNPVKNQTLTAIGHGVIEDGSQSWNLLKVDLFAQVECPQVVGPTPDCLLCAGDTQGGDICFGDAGGPLFDNSGNVVGVTADTLSCTFRGFPDLFARVSFSIDWIESTICAMSYSTNKPCWCNPNGCNGERVQVMITVKHDEYPQETSWNILDTWTKQVLVQQTVGSVKTVNSVQKKVFFVQKGRKYALNVWDSESDGICCGYGSGYVQIHKRVGGKWSSVYKNLGEFGPKLWKALIIN